MNPGTSFDYTIVVTNNGPSDAANLPGHRHDPGAPAPSRSPGSCASAGACGNVGNDVTCTLASLDLGGDLDDHRIGPPGPGHAGWALHRHGQRDVHDVRPRPGEQRRLAEHDRAPRRGPRLTKSDGIASVIAGTSTTYTITLTNSGPSNVGRGHRRERPDPRRNERQRVRGRLRDLRRHVHVHDDGVAVPGLGHVPAHARRASELRAGQPFQHRLHHRLPGSGDQPLERLGHRHDTVVLQGDLAVTKTDGVGSVVAGTSTTYTITATNNGPSHIPAGVVLSDPIPAGTVGSESEA